MVVLSARGLSYHLVVDLESKRSAQMVWMGLGVALVMVLMVAIHDLTQKKHAILRNFPVVGHARYFFERIGPELRQYIVTGNNEERPFSRDQRAWVYASAKKENNLRGFGSDERLETSPNFIIIKHAAFPWRPPEDYASDPSFRIPVSKTLGGWRKRPGAFVPDSTVYVSAMSYGSLSSAAVVALNQGCAMAHALHNTGEGGIAPYHDQGGDLIYQLGTGYYGARTPDGRCDLEQLARRCTEHQVRVVEIKLSQGAKPGKGGILPAKKVTPEIAEIRGIPVGKSCESPAYHREFSDVPGLVAFVERVAEATGLPVAIKAAVGDTAFWADLADHMAATGQGPDMIHVDGGEGGTGAAPLVFSDHVALPFKIGFSRVYNEFLRVGLHEHIVFAGAGRLGFPEEALLAHAMGCDMIAVAREAMMAIGCIQAQKCHTGHCPTGVATQQKWYMRGLDPTLKSARLANYLVTLRKEVLALCHACGVDHPSKVDLARIELIDDRFGSRPASEVFGLPPVRPSSGAGVEGRA